MPKSISIKWRNPKDSLQKGEGDDHEIIMNKVSWNNDVKVHSMTRNKEEEDIWCEITIDSSEYVSETYIWIKKYRCK